MTELGTLGAYSSAVGINDKCQIVGYSRFSNEEIHHACLWDLSNITLPTPSNTYVPEDINGDRSVNMRDVVLIASHFNTVSTDNNYDVKCDLNNDKAINLVDIVMIAAKFNLTY